MRRQIRRRYSGERVHPVLAAMELDAIIENQPVLMFVADDQGNLVYRNKMSTEKLEWLRSEYGDIVVSRIRDEIKEITRTVRAFPHTRMVTIPVAGRNTAFEINISSLGSGFLGNWRDVTDDQIRAEVLRTTANDLAEAAAKFGALSGQLAGTSEKVSGRMVSVATAVEQFVASIADISASSTAAAANAGTAVTTAAGARDRIERLNESTERVETVSRLINGIAEQTNLLALNATIEAARAGELGKGFAVVAGEVKDLAGRTSAATDQISAIMQAIRSDVDNTITGIVNIVEVAGKVEDEQTTIAGAVEEQAATASEISSTVTTVAANVEASATAAADLHSEADALRVKAQSLRELF